MKGWWGCSGYHGIFIQGGGDNSHNASGSLVCIIALITSLTCSHRILFYYFTKNVASERKFFIVNSKEKGVASEISLYKDLIDVKTHSNDRVRVLKPYLFVLVCLLIELH